MLTRQKELMQWLVGGFTTSGLIVGGVWLTDHPSELAPEIFASTPPSKSAVLKAHSEASLEPDRKASGYMQISLTSSEGRKSDGTLALQANVIATTLLNDLKYEWVFPDGAVLASGPSSGSFGDVAEGSQVSASVVVNVPVSNTRVVFHAYREMAGQKVGQVAQYNSTDSSSIDMKLALKRESTDRKPAATDRRYE